MHWPMQFFSNRALVSQQSTLLFVKDSMVLHHLKLQIGLQTIIFVLRNASNNIVLVVAKLKLSIKYLGT